MYMFLSFTMIAFFKFTEIDFTCRETHEKHKSQGNGDRRRLEPLPLHTVSNKNISVWFMHTRLYMLQVSF